MTVIVRLDRDENGTLIGVIERVRTGEKVRVRSLEEIPAVLAVMLAADEDAPVARESSPSRRPANREDAR